MSKKGGHHGGAWKVAYADFVTAMMALFMVLWLAAQDQKIKEAVERAFRHPFMSLTKESSGLMPTKNQNTGKSSVNSIDLTGAATPSELAMLRKLQKQLMESLQGGAENENIEAVQFELTRDGLRINVFDRARRPIFNPDSAELTDYGGWILTTLAWEIARQRTFKLELEGHTERGFVAVGPQYGSWELSADRANSGRRKLVEHGVGLPQIVKVAGFADTRPVADALPEDPINRRLTLLLRVKEEPGT